MIASLARHREKASMEPSAWEIASSIATVLAALFAGWAAFEARGAAKNANEQSKRSEDFQREQSIDAQWMRYQDFYKDTIGLYAGSPGMALENYEKLDGVEKRKLHLTAIALLQTLDLAYRAGDEMRARNLKRYLQWNEGPLATVGAIDAGALKHARTFADWNEIRSKHGKPPVTAAQIEAIETATHSEASDQA
jgi:hypothetical protein